MTKDLTTVRAVNGNSARVHVGWDEGSFDTVPLCPALRTRETETVDALATCPDCKHIVREQWLEMPEGVEDLFYTWRCHTGGGE